jgi:hypothetical protein
MRFLSVILLLLTLPVFKPQPIDAAQKSASEPAQKASPKSDSMANDVQAMRQDVARMKALVQQMQTNLAFVDTTQSPLKHQFQLEIEMWQTMIVDMDRRLDQASREPAHKP